jgi:hypothetical protein
LSEDSCSLTALIVLPDGFTPAGKLVSLDIGGARSSFTLDTKNKAVNSQGHCTFKFNKKTNNWTITVSLTKADLQDSWVAHDLVNAPVSKPGNPVILPVTVLVGNEAFAADKTLSYTAKAGQSGTAK